MSYTRRFFLKSSGIALIGMSAVPSFLTRAATAVRGKGKTLVVIFQRGAADGLNIVVPHGEKAYYDLRESIAVGRPKKGDDDTAIDLDGFFGLHPSLDALQPLWDAKMLAVVHAAGSPDSTRSHFDAQDFMESGTPGVKSTRDGWLNRYMQAREAEIASSFRAVSVTAQLPRILQGNASALAIPDVARFGIEGRYSTIAERGLEALYRASGDMTLGPTAQETFEAMDLLRSVNPSQYRPANGARYPRGEFGASMLQIAQLVKSNIGLEIAFAEIGGWDHHVNEGGAQGALANLLRQYGQGLAAFCRDLGEGMADVVVVTLSEFGRTASENGNRGTDHGHATALFVLGGEVKGGQVYGDWPGLKDDELYEGRDLALTTDYRDVVAEALTRHLGAASLQTVFPGYTVDPKNYRGFL
ncbi:MAG: DUF1501 domain-containing protein [Acidobacteriota bacterium]|nr:DUF1501 domain-containing protein [Acidobacteriota bacterium]